MTNQTRRAAAHQESGHEGRHLAQHVVHVVREPDDALAQHFDALARRGRQPCERFWRERVCDKRAIGLDLCTRARARHAHTRQHDQQNTKNHPFGFGIPVLPSHVHDTVLDIEFWLVNFQFMCKMVTVRKSVMVFTCSSPHTSKFEELAKLGIFASSPAIFARRAIATSGGARSSRDASRACSDSVAVTCCFFRPIRSQHALSVDCGLRCFVCCALCGARDSRKSDTKDERKRNE